MIPPQSVAEEAERGAGAPAAGTKRGMREDDLLRFEWIADPQISADGTRVAFTRVKIDAEADEYVTSIWLVDTAGGAPRALTSGRYDRQPRWSPDGRTLAFVRSKEPKKPGQIHLLSMEGGEAQELTRLEKGASDPAWSPDGKRLAFLSGTNPALDDPKKEKPKNEPARVVTQPQFRENDLGFTDFDHRDHVWVVSVEGGEPRPLTTGRIAEHMPTWSHDGRYVLFVSDRRPEPWFGHDEAAIYAVSPDLATPTDGAELKVVVEHKGSVITFAEGKDGRILIAGSQHDEVFRTYSQPILMVAEGPWPRRDVFNVAPSYDCPVGEGVIADQHAPRGGGSIPLGFGPGGRTVIAMAARRGSSQLIRVDHDTGMVEELTPAGCDLISGTASADGSRWALVIGSPETPGNLYLCDADDVALHKLCGPNDPLLGEVGLGAIEEIEYESFDGRKIQARIVKPPDFDAAKKYPLVLQIHGGPHTAYGAGFFHEFHALAAAGYVVLYTNPRGSTSYGQEFAELIQYAFPGDDYKDLMAGVDAVVSRGYVDPKRLGVTGGSGGGLLTNWVVTQTDRFAAAITQRCVADWASMYYSCDFTMFTPFWFRKPPYEDPQEYLDRSPANFASKITTPLMIIHSEEDWRTPIGQGEAMFRALKHQKKTAVMVRFPGESHELSRSGAPSRRVQNQQHIRRWFDHWLQDKRQSEYEA